MTTEWNDIKDVLPEHNTEVLVWIDGHRGPAWSNNYAKVAYLSPYDNKWYTVGEDNHSDTEVIGVIGWAFFWRYKEILYK